MDDCLVKSFRIQTNPDLVGCCEQDHAADPVGWHCAFLPDSFSFESFSLAMMQSALIMQNEALT